MSSQRTHYVTTSDGVIIGGTVHGTGRPLVFVHGMLADGDLDWQLLLPHMTSGFTCHLPSYRGRGLSGDHPDLSPGRIAEDILTYVESIEAPTWLVGWSSGAYLALIAAAARPHAVQAVAAFEPGILSLMDEQEQASHAAAGVRMGELVAAGDLPGAVRAFAGWPFNEEELAIADDSGYFDAAARYVPNLLKLLPQWGQYEGPSPDDPAVLGAIASPVLVLHGADTTPFLATSARHVTDHVPDARLHAIPNVGHAAPLTDPGALAAALTDFFS